MLERLRSEPVVSRAVVGALLAVLIEFGVPITQGQQTALTVLVLLLLGVSARGRVTPVERPRRDQRGAIPWLAVIGVCMVLLVLFAVFGSPRIHW